ncbi:hypothetical protein BKA64DRAFT_649636 [Cadophora sp. MPI-SDFR-AT-0126]|nr:hypothetical protein BKA64DRAFT_649636 [Leotiomycetes sp. MPI-SDFR-AT-0126]
MSEPSKLKVRFDEIFEAQKYTKAIDNINKISKFQRIELGKLKIHEANFKELKDKAERRDRRPRGQATVSQVEIAAAEKVSAEKHRLKTEAHSIAGKLEQKKNHAEFLESSLESLRTNLVELKESCMNGSRLPSTNMRNAWPHIENGQMSELISSIQLLRSILSADMMVDLDDSQITRFVQRVHKLSRDKERELESVKKATADELRQTQANLTKLDQRKATLNQEKNIRRRQADMTNIDMDEGAKAKLDAALSDAEERLAKANSDWDSASWDQNLKAEKANLKELEQEATRLGEELFQINKLAKDRAALEYAKKEAKNARQSLETMLSTHQEQLNELIGSDWTPDTLQEEFEAVLEQRTHTLKDLKTQQDSAVQQLSQTQFELKTARATAAKKKAELDKNMAKVLASITDDQDNAIHIP